MKKITLLLLLFTTLANAQLTFTDPWLKNYLLASTATNNIAINFSLQSVKIDVNSNGQIEASEAALIKRIWIEHPNVTNLGGIEGFSNLTDLDVKLTPLTAVTMAPMPSLQKLQFLECASLTSVNISGLTGLTQIAASENPLMTSLTLNGCTSMTNVIVRNTGLTSLNVSGNTSIANMYLDNNQISSINVSGCTAMNGINLENNPLVSLNVSGLSNLVGIILTDNTLLTSINAAGCSALTSVTLGGATAVATIDLSNCSSLQGISVSAMTNLTTLNLSGCSSLIGITTGNPLLTSLNVTGCTTMQSLTSTYGQITNLDFTGCSSLKYVTAFHNQLATINVSDSPNLEQLLLADNLITNLDVSGHTQLQQLTLENNPVAFLNASGCSALPGISFPTTGLGSWVDVNFSGCTSLIGVHILSEQLQNINIQGCTSMEYIVLGGSSGTHAPITSIDASNLPTIYSVKCYYTDIASVDLDNSPNITILALYLCNMPVIDLSIWPNLTQITLASPGLEIVDVSNQHQIFNLDLNNNPDLKQIFAKNGAQEGISLMGCPQLEFICQDETAIGNTTQYVTSAGLTGVVVNSYCSFTPGGDYNTITGLIRFDLNNNGCEASDLVQPNIKININDGTLQGATFTNPTGNYTFYTAAGSFDLTPSFENQSIFTITPGTATIPFADENNNTATQNFCVAPNGIHPDVEIVIAPISPARPGFPAWYMITIKNKGNQTVSGTYSLAFEDDLMDFVIATIAPTSQTTGLLNWNYTNLLPFESRSIYLGMNINTPTQIPPVNLGDILTYTATINPIAGDDHPADNQLVLEQEAVNSYDPNDITCIEGDVVSPSEIGNYLHYIVNFENTGTAEAENVVVRVEIDPDKYDINSLQLMSNSHPVRAVITGNTAEFIFEGINLGVAGDPPVGGHGNVLFKIRTLPTLVTGDQVENKADIYFDYNAPIETDVAISTFQSLGNPDLNIDESVVMYPNPTKQNIHIDCDNVISTVELFDIQGRILQAMIPNTNTTVIDISDKANGVYFIKITTDKGQKVEKLVKE